MCGLGTEVGRGGSNNNSLLYQGSISLLGTFQSRESVDPVAGTQGPRCLASVLSLIGLLQSHLPG